MDAASQSSRTPPVAEDAYTIAFCGGGSGGHVVPSFAIVQALLRRQPCAKLLFFLSARPVDQRVITSHKSIFSGAEFVRQPLTGSRPRLRYLLGLVRSLVLCRQQMKQHRPDVVIGTGGFASIPGVLVAAWLKIPIVLLETNRVPGRATRRLVRFAHKVLVGWPLTNRSHLPGIDPETIGVPVFFPLEATDAVASRKDGSSKSDTVFRILILGGSQGAARLNELVCSAISQLPMETRLQIIHQTGGKEFRQDQMPPEIQLTQFAFLPNVPEQLHAADLVICRSGAVTLAEIAMAGTPAILVPMSSSADDHQRENAMWFVEHAAAAFVDERSPTAVAQLRDTLLGLLNASGARDELATAVRRLAEPSAAEKAVKCILQVVGRSAGDLNDECD